MSDFAGKVTLVTGGASGIGLALGQALAREGARVVLADKDEARVREAAARLAGEGGSVHADGVDVADSAAVHAWVQGVVAREGRLDYLFNNAGTAYSGEVREMSAAHWERIVSVNVWGVIHGVQAAYPILVQQGHGHLVNVASAAGLSPAPLGAAYAMTKHAVVGLSLSLREEALALGVDVSVVCPGFVDTGIFEHALQGGTTARWIVGRTPIRLCPAARAAQRILRGVRRKRAVIVFPFHAHAIVWASRWAPALMSRFAQGTLRDYRSGRSSS